MSIQHDALTKAKEKMEKSIAAFKRELVSIRAGRALSLIHIYNEYITKT